MDKVNNFEEIQQEQENSDEINELESNEITDEEREYYNSLITKKGIDFNLMQKVQVKTDKKKQKNLEKQKMFEKDKEELVNLLGEKKMWKSSRANKMREKDGKIIESRKFNPRPLPPDWDHEFGGIKKKIKEIPNKQSFPILGKVDDKPKLPITKMTNIWSKMLKKIKN